MASINFSHFLKHFWLVNTLFVCLLSGESTSEKIVFFHHLCSYSHRIQTFPLAEELARKGHDVTFISPHHPKHPNPIVKELVAPEHAKMNADIMLSDFDINLKITRELPNLIDYEPDLGVKICEVFYTSPTFKKWLKENPVADLVIVDGLYAECGTGLAYKLGAKFLYFSTIPLMPYEYDSFGFLPEASAIPEQETYALTPPFGFWDRMSNALESLKWRWKFYFDYIPKMDALIRKELGVNGMPDLDDLMKSPGVVLFTGDVVTDYPRVLPPLFVNIAGIHLKKSNQNLPRELQDFINKNTSKTPDDGMDGFIYISFGSMVTSSNLPAETKKIFFDVIRSFPKLKFLWKWNGKVPQGIPENVYLSKWFPQSDLLAHPKIRGFISQCGRPSTMEALFEAVPMICFPVVCDQEINADRLKGMGALVRLDIGHVVYEDLKAGIEQALYDTKLKAKILQLRNIFLDRPMTPLDTAVWWTEYVLRHEDTVHLQPAGNYQYWFVRRGLDVWVTLTLAALLLGLCCVMAIRRLCIAIWPTQAKLKRS